MDATARDSNQFIPADTNGLDALFAEGGPEGGPCQLEAGTVAGSSSDQGGPVDALHTNEVSAEQAATILGISVRAVLKRLNKGSLSGRKVVTKFGEKWLIDRNELPSTVYVEMVEQGGPVQSEAGAVPGTGFGQDGPKDGPNNNVVAQLMATTMNNQNDLIATVMKQAQIIELLTADLRQKDEQIIKILTDSQHKPSWWAKLKGTLGLASR